MNAGAGIYSAFLGLLLVSPGLAQLSCDLVTCFPGYICAIRTSNGAEVPSCVVDPCRTTTCGSGYVCEAYQSNGQSIPRCVKGITCPQLNNPANGYVNPGGINPGETSAFGCDSGYQLSHNRDLTCQSDGTYDNDIPTCERNPNDICQGVTCPSGYTCQSYQSNSQFRCVPVPDPNEDICKPVNCDNGYKCQVTRVGDQDQAVCIPITCNLPQAPANGRVIVQGLLQGNVAEFICNSGYRLVGPTTTTCQNEEKFVPEPPTCVKESTCPQLNNPTNGYVNPGGINPGQTSEFGCNSGYQLSHNRDLTCQSDGTYDNDIPICERTRCPIPTNPANGDIYRAGNNPGQIAEVYCDNGYVPSGPTTLTCQEDGNYDYPVPSCRQVTTTCQVLAAPANGRIIRAGQNPGEITQVACNNDYVPSGQTILRCQGDGTYDYPVPSCERVTTTCQVLAAPANGRIIRAGQNPGEITQVACNNDYVPSGQTILRCQGDGTYDYPVPSCERVTTPCQVLAAPANGRIIRAGQNPGEITQVACNNDYVPSGQTTLRCQGDGTYDYPVPSCERVERATCRILTAPTNGRKTVQGRNPGQLSVFDCDRGFTLVGQRVLICQNDGNYNHNVPRCQTETQTTTCPRLSAPSNGRVDVQGTTPFQQTVFTCDSGYTLIGQPVLTCQSNGGYNNDVPTCERITCAEPTSLSNGFVRLNGRSPGGTAEYECNSNYQLTGQPVLTCQSDGSWDYPTPQCLIEAPEVGRCAKPLVQNGRVLVEFNEREILTNNRIRVTCNANYRPSRFPDIVVCQRNGQYEPPAPSCVRDPTCPPPPPIGNGIISIENSDNSQDVKDGTRIIYSCNSGYVIIGRSTLVCQSSGEYDRSAPRCESNPTCPLPPSIQNGNPRIVNSDNSQVIRVGTQVIYSCNPGYTIRGSSTLVCQSNLQYNPQSAPTCERNPTCPQPPSIQNGNPRIVNSDNSQVIRVGTQVIYSCNPGYTIRGSSTLVCQSNRQYNPQSAPTCERTCPQPPSIQNGNPSIVNSDNSQVIRVGTQVIYSCNSGYTIRGSSTLVCQSNRQYNPQSAPTCERQTAAACSTPPSNPSNGYYIVRYLDSSRTIHSGTEVNYYCNSGYQPSGQSRIICDNGRYSGGAPTCVRLNTDVLCSSPSQPINGYYIVTYPDASGLLRDGTSVAYYCYTGFRLNGGRTAICQGGQYSIATPTCQQGESKCRLPGNDEMENGKILVIGYNDGQDLSPGKSIRIICDSGYRPKDGIERLTCMPSGNFNKDIPPCERIPGRCPVPQKPPAGRVTVGGTRTGDKSTFTCDPGYTLRGASEVTCQPDGTYYPPIPTCY